MRSGEGFDGRPRWRVALAALAAALMALVLTRGPAVREAAADPRPRVTIQLLSFSDWHGQLDPLSVTGVGNVGGAAVLSAYFQRERAANPYTLTLTAGDATGGTPPLSGFFNDEPAVDALNLMGLDANTFGNHDFDHGIPYLQNLVDRARFPFVSSNLSDVAANLRNVAPYVVRDVGGVRVAIVGVTNPDAHDLVFPGSFGTIHVTDPVPAANRARARAAGEGARVFVAITHLGITDFDPATGAPRGPLVDFANAVGNFDVILGDHTDVQWSGVINNHLVVENRSKGATYARTTLTLDPANGRVASRAAQFVVPLAGAVTPDPAIVAMLAPYRVRLAAAFDAPAGVATGLFPRGGNVERVGEVAVGNLVADAMRIRYGVQVALTNGGGLRAPLPSSYLPANTALRRPAPGYAAGPPYDLVVGDIYTLLPFGNEVVTRTVTGAQLYAALENGVSRMPAADGRFPQISGFRFSYDASRPAGSRVVSVTLDDGTAVQRDGAAYTFATNNFVNAGGDGYTALADGQGTSREVMADVVLAYVRALGTITPSIEGRITRLP